MEISKKLKYIEERYKDDPEELARAKADFIRKHGMPGLPGVGERGQLAYICTTHVANVARDASQRGILEHRAAGMAAS